MSLGLNWTLRLIPHGSWDPHPGVTHRCGFIVPHLPSMRLNHNLSQNSMVLGEGAEHQCLCVMFFVSPVFSDPCSKVVPDAIGWLRTKIPNQWEAYSMKSKDIETHMHAHTEWARNWELREWLRARKGV
jgi:hypothetical protein